MVECICRSCGKIFDVAPSHIKRGEGKYCSRACKGSATRNTIECICKTCGRSFNVIPSKINKGWGKYCSHHCHSVTQITSVERICQQCGKSFYVHPSVIKIGGGKYCSTPCKNASPEYRDNKIASLKKAWGNPESRVNHSAGQKKRYENPEERARMSAAMIGDKNWNWNGGISFAPYCHKFDKARKRAVRSFFGYHCIICGCHQLELKTSLSVHHIDHDKEQGCSGKPFNLVPMCMSCHSKEQHNEEEYRKYINNILHEGFKWGVWNKQEYIEKVMY